MSRVVLDLGGTGARVAELTTDGRVASIHRLQIDSLAALIAAINDHGSVSWVGVSVPGIVRMNTGFVERSTVARWLEGDLQQTLSNKLGCPVAVLHDGAAHALSFRGKRGIELGSICLALGTSVGFGVLDENGTLVTSLSGTSFEVGDLRLQTSASNSSAWWAAGAPGLEELERTYGSKVGQQRFGSRVGALARTLALVFQPRSVCFSGGFVAKCWPLLKDPIHEELFGCLRGGETPQVLAASSVEPALDGLASLIPLD